MSEGTRMHSLNVLLLNEIFNQKKKELDLFFETEYTPLFVKNFLSKVDLEALPKEELPGMIASISARVSKVRDSKQLELEQERLKLLGKLNTDHQKFLEASAAVTALLQSAVDIDKARRNNFQLLKELSNERLDLDAITNQVNQKLDEIINQIK